MAHDFGILGFAMESYPQGRVWTAGTPHVARNQGVQPQPGVPIAFNYGLYYQ